jgi:hypothetical protein
MFIAVPVEHIEMSCMFNLVARKASSELETVKIVRDGQTYALQ